MKNLSKEEFEIYCLLIAADADFDITKQELIDRQNHFERMKRVFFADGKFQVAEQSVFTMLRKLI